MNASRLLLQAKKLIRLPEHWTKGDFHREGPDGMAYCLMGALYEAGTELGADAWAEDQAMWTLRDVVNEKTGVFSPITFNDSLRTEHQDVLDMLDHAIARALEKENR